MANVNLKTDFKDGEKLFGQQLNNNFSVIKAALDAANKIAWQDDPDDSVTAFRGTTEEINQRDVIDGQLLYDTTTGETYIDVGSQRISTGSGNAIHIGSDTPSNPSTQIWIDPNEPLQAIGTEVTNSMEGTESNKAPSVQAVKNYINSRVQILWTNPNPSDSFSSQTIALSSDDYDEIGIYYYDYRLSKGMQYIRAKKGESIRLITIFWYDSKIYLANRKIDFTTSTSVAVDNATGIETGAITTPVVANAQCIPIYFVGYKTGILN